MARISRWCVRACVCVRVCARVCARVRACVCVHVALTCPRILSRKRICISDTARARACRAWSARKSNRSRGLLCGVVGTRNVVIVVMLLLLLLLLFIVITILYEFICVDINKDDDYWGRTLQLIITHGHHAPGHRIISGRVRAVVARCSRLWRVLERSFWICEWASE